MTNTDILNTALDVNEINNNKELLKEVLKYGDVPVIYGPTKSMLKPPAEPGLSNLIDNAMSKQEVENLLKKGELDYKNASAKTIRKWRKIADKRIQEIGR